MNMLALTIIFPLIGFLLLSFSRGRWSENLSATIGMGSVGLAALVTAYAGIDFFNNGRQAFSVPLWTWMSVGDFNIGFNLVLDGLSLTMLSVVAADVSRLGRGGSLLLPAERVLLHRAEAWRSGHESVCRNPCG